jgi:hypothetical protein
MQKCQEYGVIYYYRVNNKVDNQEQEQKQEQQEQEQELNFE